MISDYQIQIPQFPDELYWGKRVVCDNCSFSFVERIVERQYIGIKCRIYDAKSKTVIKTYNEDEQTTKLGKTK